MGLCLFICVYNYSQLYITQNFVGQEVACHYYDNELQEKRVGWTGG
jgi:hypothetical protein